MAPVRLCGVTKKFGQNIVLHEIDLEVADREFLVLVGPSGCGKSTLLRLIAGLEEVTDGSIYLGDRQINHLPPKVRDIAMVFQSYAPSRAARAIRRAAASRLRGTSGVETVCSAAIFMS